ncbi:hypothetical protein [Micromonospora sp. NPDC023814]|uniref:hypothetical protein n=1 Tax=Micromonospora sp. NPDC023814 TaxID=3154596 RepID=UPI0033E8BA22
MIKCTTGDHRTLGRWLKQHPSTGRLSIGPARVTVETKLDGKYLLATSDAGLCPRRMRRLATRTCWKPTERSFRA